MILPGPSPTRATGPGPSAVGPGARSPARSLRSGPRGRSGDDSPKPSGVGARRSPGALGAERDELLALAHRGRQRGWWQEHAGAVGDPLVDCLSLEQDANHVGVLGSPADPRLLQIREYAGAVFRAGRTRETEEQVDTFVDVRMRRQHILREGGPSLWAVAIEGVLRQQVGDPT
ncbi:Scr1 family TA system antitoxin-like transcriptional regulator [Embleya sp. MST-111070]|uniref:Scr1 family TA system antitoxin-like transcriptional regulator n=1 Tax=Embleya sp. MST-111070 TaxID=3398231 RepID=UPI003F73E316